MQAVRENRYIILAKDFEKGYKNNIRKGETEHDFYKQTTGDVELRKGQRGSETNIYILKERKLYYLLI